MEGGRFGGGSGFVFALVAFSSGPTSVSVAGGMGTIAMLTVAAISWPA